MTPPQLRINSVEAHRLVTTIIYGAAYALIQARDARAICRRFGRTKESVENVICHRESAHWLVMDVIVPAMGPAQWPAVRARLTQAVRDITRLNPRLNSRGIVANRRPVARLLQPS